MGYAFCCCCFCCFCCCCLCRSPALSQVPRANMIRCHASLPSTTTRIQYLKQKQDKNELKTERFQNYSSIKTILLCSINLSQFNVIRLYVSGVGLVLSSSLFCIDYSIYVDYRTAVRKYLFAPSSSKFCMLHIQKCTRSRI